MMLAPSLAASSTRRIFTCALEIGSSPAPAQHCLPLRRWHHLRRNCRRSASTVVSPPLRNVSRPSQRMALRLLPKHQPRHPSHRLHQNPRQNRHRPLSQLRLPSPHLHQSPRQRQNQRQPPSLCRKSLPSQLLPLRPKQHPSRPRRQCRKLRLSQLRHPNQLLPRLQSPFRKSHHSQHQNLRPLRRRFPRPVRLSSPAPPWNSPPLPQNPLRRPNRWLRPNSQPQRQSLPRLNPNSARLLRLTFPQICRPNSKTTMALSLISCQVATPPPHRHG